jgi:type I restriction enzyme R subunit
MFRDYTDAELAVIKAKYGTEGNVLEAPELIAPKAKDMLRHYVDVVMPEGFKAQVVATSRLAAVRYHEKLMLALELVTELEALPPETWGCEMKWQRDAQTQFVRAHPLLEQLKALEIAAVVSGDHNDRSRGASGPTATNRRKVVASSASWRYKC